MAKKDNGISALLEPLTSSAAISRFRDRSHKFELVSRRSWFFFVHQDDWFVSTVRSEDRNLDVARMHRRLNVGAPGHQSEAPEGVDLFIQKLAQATKSMVFMDIGANYGQTAVSADKLLQESGARYEVLSFEPGVAADCLAVNVDLNQCKNVQCFDAAFSNVDGFIPIYSMDGHTEDNKIVNPAAEATVFPVRSIRLDTAMTQYPTALKAGNVFFKIDTQGAEVEVMSGAQDIIANHQMLSLMEFSPLSIASRRKPAEWLGELADSMHVIACGPRQGMGEKVTTTAAGLEAFVEEVKTSKARFCDLVLISRKHPRIKQITKILQDDFGLSL